MGSSWGTQLALLALGTPRILTVGLSWPTVGLFWPLGNPLGVPLQLASSGPCTRFPSGLYMHITATPAVFGPRATGHLGRRRLPSQREERLGAVPSHPPVWRIARCTVILLGRHPVDMRFQRESM